MSRQQKLLYFFWLLIFVLMAWCSSGTLAPYAATLTTPTVLKPCNYLANIDHGVFEGTFRFLDGAPVEVWRDNPVLRRILYPLLAYPLMSEFGFLLGGFYSNLILTLASVLIFIRYIVKNYGHTAGVYSFAILATYPGIAYWIALPYSYVAIVPCSLISFVVLSWSEKHATRGAYLTAAFVVGLLAVAYDLLPFFGVALLFLLLLRKHFIITPLALVLLVVPTVLTIWILHTYGAALVTSNSVSYGNIIWSYFSPPEFSKWWPLIREVPEILFFNFLHSNFFVLPIAFVLVFLIGRFLYQEKLNRVEVAVICAVLFVFLFNNLAPPYEGWQLRGFWIARIYQPLFVVYLIYMIRSLSSVQVSSNKNLVKYVLWISIAANAVIVFGPIFRHKPAEYAYHRFYQHSHDSKAMTKNLTKYHKRPLGYCKKRLKKRKKNKL